jgi:predicted amidophosphoribosyltransferase
MTGRDDSGADVFMQIGGHDATLCENCERPMFGTQDLCNECVGSVPIAELEQLADEMEHDAETTQNGPNYRAACKKYADEINQLIAEYRGDEDE